jgi:hypothetical protein
MIITDPLTARVALDYHHAEIPEAYEAAAEQCARQIIAAGEDVGAFIRRESIWAVKRRLPEWRNGEVADVIALWAPDPAAGVHLRGGPLDGEIIALRREDDGRPMDRVRVPVPGGDAVAEYGRDGIDSESDVWVYAYRSQTQGPDIP